MKPRFQFLFNEAGTEAGSAGGAAATATPAAAPAAATPPPVFNQDGAFGENWHASLGDEFTPHAAALKDFKDVKGLAKSYLHFRTTGPQYPTDQSAPEDITRFHALAKVPAEGTPTAYGITLPDGLAPEESAIYDRITAAAHKAHAPAPAVAAIVQEYQKVQAEILQAEQQRVESEKQKGQDALIAKWGSKFQENSSIARHITETLGNSAGIPSDDPHMQALFNNPAFAQMAVEFAKHTEEDRTRLPAGFGDIRSPQQKINSIMDGTDPVWGKKYTEGTQEEQLAAYQEVVRLQNLASQ